MGNHPVAELVAIAGLGVSVLGAHWRLYKHLDERLDLLQVERESLRAEIRIIDYRLARLEESRGELAK